MENNGQLFLFSSLSLLVSQEKNWTGLQFTEYNENIMDIACPKTLPLACSAPLPLRIQICK